MTCTTCGAELPERSATCPTCGAGVAATVGGSANAGTPPSDAGADHPSGYPSEARNWALGAHLSAFLGSFVAMAFVGPLVVWLIRKDTDAFSTRHAREALNFNLTILLVIVVGGVALIPLALLTIGLILIPAALAAAAIGIGWIVLTIVAAVRAADGQEYRYPLTIRFIR
jgi:uncharacterized protein